MTKDQMQLTIDSLTLANVELAGRCQVAEHRLATVYNDYADLKATLEVRTTEVHGLTAELVLAHNANKHLERKLDGGDLVAGRLVDNQMDLIYDLAHMTNNYYKAQHWSNHFRAQRDNHVATIKEMDAANGKAVRVARAPSAKAEFTEGMTLEQRRAAMAAAKAAATA